MPAPPLVTVWVDPGGMTGIAGLYHGNFWADEHAWGQAMDKLTGYAHHYQSLLHIGYEKFTILPQTHKLHPEPEAYEIPGVIKYLCHVYHCVLLPPAMPSARNIATPAMLKAIGWWTPGEDDAQSASQHLLAWMIREKCVPPDLSWKLAAARSITP